jgi:hypothetical protein
VHKERQIQKNNKIAKKQDFLQFVPLLI